MNELIKRPDSDTTKRWERTCPKCRSQITYKHRSSFYTARKQNTMCILCVSKDRAEKHDFVTRFSGQNNPFYGKKHSKATRLRMSKVDRSWMTGSLNPMKNIDRQKKFSERFSGAGNPMYGTHLSEERKREYSIRFSGKGNPMYGKSSPQGSGNGWANWYKGRHFRSLRELQYFITEIDEQGISCESAQSKRFRIPYKDKDGVERTYSPDFFVGGHTMVEIKPKKLWNTISVKVKQEAGEQFCQERGWTYRLVDVQPNSMLLKEKYLAGEIRFVEKYKQRFERYIGLI